MGKTSHNIITTNIRDTQSQTHPWHHKLETLFYFLNQSFCKPYQNTHKPHNYIKNKNINWKQKMVEFF